MGLGEVALGHVLLAQWQDRLEIEDTFQRAFDRSLTEAKPRYVALAVGNRPMSAEPAFSLTFKETEHAALRAH
ncbi:hypothetical protein HDU88_005158 [Geranomyces variabilis]|nr:hypothetical protein HDU88_005158 [Geranomyces variabilis]